MIAKNTKVTIEVDAKHEAILRRALAMAEEMEQLALTAADGQVVHECELAVIEKGRQLQQQMLGAAVERRIESVEKKNAAAELRLRAAEGKQRAQESSARDGSRHD